MKRSIFIGLGIIAILLFGIGSFSMWEIVPAGQICVIQTPWSGDLMIHTEPGTKWQGFGKVTMYPRSGVLEFNQPVDPNDETQKKYYDPLDDKSMKVTFNDGGEAWISGSIRYDYPLEVEKIKILHKMFSSHDSVVNGLIVKTVERSVYMSGPLMSSIESFMSRRAELPKLIEDQAKNGLYDVITKDVMIEDEFTGEKKTVKIAKPIDDINAVGGFKRQEESVLSRFGLTLQNFTTNNISYSDKVQSRVDALFAAASDIQIATLNAKKAEQDKKTAEEKGKADAMAAEWKARTVAAEEEAAAQKIANIQNIDAQRDKDIAVIAANKNREVAEQEKITAGLYRDAQLLKAEGDSTYKRKMMEADGALGQKLEAYKYAVDRVATAIEKHQGAWVPGIVMGGNTTNGAKGTTDDLINLLTVKTANDLGLDLKVNK